MEQIISFFMFMRIFVIEACIMIAGAFAIIIFACLLFGIFWSILTGERFI